MSKDKTKFILLTKAEIQSGYDRQKAAEGLILQLPEDHDVRNTWLLQYGVREEARALRANHPKPVLWDAKRRAAETLGSKS